jgi:thioredoxin reductase (NADPH)
MEEQKIHDVIIAGSGPAGLTAAIYAARSDLDVLVVAGVEAGGQLIWTTDVEDFPGFPEGVQGPDLVGLFRKQAERLGAKFVLGDISEAKLNQRPFEVKVGQQSFFGKTLILATGASAKWLGIESEQRLRGKGVSACAVCDGAFFKGKQLAVVGGGDSALREALFLTKFSPKVYIIHRRDQLRAFKALQDRVLSNESIEFVWNSETVEVLGENKVEGLKVKNNQTGEEKVLEVGGVFIAIGHKPNTEFLKNQVELDKAGYVVLKGNSKTSVPGVFAAGDVHDWKYQQAVTAAGAGCMAALEVEDFLEEEKASQK